MTNNWHMITIKDKSNLSGKSFSRLVSSLTNAKQEQLFCVIRGLDASGSKLPELNSVMETSSFIDPKKLINIANDLVQIAWGDFYFFDHESDVGACVNEKDYLDWIRRSSFTIRAIDAEEFHIFTNDNNIVKLVSTSYSSSKKITGRLEEFEFPD